jgi:PAS domain-containing protein
VAAAASRLGRRSDNRDITKRKRMEVAPRESEDRYRGLVDNVPGIAFTMDLAGRVTFVSRRVKETLGYESADVINKSAGFATLSSCSPRMRIATPLHAHLT